MGLLLGFFMPILGPVSVIGSPILIFGEIGKLIETWIKFFA